MRIDPMPRAAAQAAILALVLCLAACSRGCRDDGSAESPAPAPAPKSTPAEATPAPVPAPTPTVVEILRLAPESATLAVAFPSSGTLFDEWLQLAKRVAPDPDALQAWVDELLRVGALRLESPDARSFSDLLRAQGIDPTAPVALFIDTAPMARAYQETLETIRAEKPEGEGSDRWQPQPDAAPRDLEIDVSPAVAAVFRYADAALAERVALSFAAHGAQDRTEREVATPGLVIRVGGPRNIAYFLRDGWLVLGNSETFLDEIADRVAKPADVRYGTEDVPARETDDAVALVRADKLARLGRSVLPVAALARPGLAPWIELQYPLLERGAEAYSADPAVVTLERSDDRIELVSRLDYARHPNLEKLFGEPGPLRLATMLPGSSTGVLSLRITDESKRALEDAWFAGLRQNRIRDPQVVMSMNVLKLLMTLTRNHVAIGAAGVRDGWPMGVAAIEVEDPDSTKAWLVTMGMSLEPVEVYRDTEIMQVPLPLAVGVYYALSGNVLFLADDLPLLRESLDLAQSGAVSPFFAKLNPPFDPAQPRYNALLLADDFFTGVLRPLVLAPGRTDRDPVVETVTRVAANVRQVQASRLVRDGWREGRLTIFLE